MKPARFDYARPATLEAALALLAAHGPEASVLAGGQSLMPMLALRVARPALLVDIGRIPGLDGIAAGPDGAVHLGARARHAAVLAAAEVPALLVPALLAQALPHVAHPAIRNRGTIGGSLALADPAAELPACAICLDAVLVAASAAGGERRIRASDFFRSAYATALLPEELLVRAEIPDPAGWRFGFAEVARRHGDYALAGMALAIRPAAVGGRVAEARIVPFGLEAAPRRIGAAEQALAAEGIEAAVMALRAALDPMESPEAPAAWRRHLSGTVLRRALAMAEGGPHGHHP